MTLSSFKSWEYGNTESISITQNRLYASFGNVLKVYDITSPSNPVLITDIQDSGVLWGGGSHVGRFIDSNTSTVAVTRFGEGVKLIDSSTFQQTLIPSSDYVNGICIYGNNLYIASTTNITVINTNPLSLTPDLIINNISSGVFSNGIYIVAAQSNMLSIYNSTGSLITTYTVPTSTTDPVTDVAFNPSISSQLIIGTRMGYVYIYDITTNTTEGTYYSGYPTQAKVAISVQGSKTYVTAAFHDVSVHIIDITDPTSPLKISEYNYVSNIGGYPRDIKVTNDNASFIIACHYKGLGIVDISTPSTPSTSYHITSYGRITASTTSNDSKYVFSIDDMGFRTLDTTQFPNESSSVAFIDYRARSGSSIDIDRTKNIVYAPSTWGGLKIINVADPLNPSIIASYKPPITYYAYYSDTVKLHPYNSSQLLEIEEIYQNVSGTVTRYAYLKILDVTTPNSPTEIGSFQLSGRFLNALDIDPDTNIAYVGNDSQILALDISNPSNITQLSAIPTPYIVNIIRLDKSRKLLYASISTKGLAIVNISSSISPYLITTYNPYTTGCEGVCVIPTTNYVYGGFEEYLSEIDTTTPSNSTIVDDELRNIVREITNIDLSNDMSYLVTSMYAGGVRLYPTGLAPITGTPPPPPISPTPPPISPTPPPTCQTNQIFIPGINKCVYRQTAVIAGVGIGVLLIVLLSKESQTIVVNH